MEIDQILDGLEAASLSHAGGEFAEILENEMRKERSVIFVCCSYFFSTNIYYLLFTRGLRKDHRDRRDCILKRTQGFQELLGPMVDAYLEWNVRLGARVFSDYGCSRNDQTSGQQTQDKNDEAMDEEGSNQRELYSIKVIDLFCKIFSFFLMIFLINAS